MVTFSQSYPVFLLTLFICGSGIYEIPAWAQKEKPSKKTTLTESQASLLYLKGRKMALNGEYEQAAKLLEAARLADPENPLVNHQLGEIYLKLGDMDRAEELINKAIAKDSENPKYFASLGALYASTRRYKEAKSAYQKVLKYEPKNQKVLLLIGIVEAEAGDLDDAIDTLGEAIEKYPGNYMAHFYRAKLYLENENIEKAKKDLNKSIAIRPSFIEAGATLGLMHERLGEVDKAIEVYSKIQGMGAFKKRLGQIYLQKNDYEKALKEFLDYEIAEPDDYTTKVKIGLIYFELKKYDKAIERFSKILKEEPKADNVRFYLGAVYEEEKKYDKAVKAFKKVSKDSSFFKEASLHIGFIYKEQKRFKEGIRFSKGLTKKHPEIPEFYDMYAAFYEYQKKYSQALKIVQTGLKRHAKDEKLLYFEGALFDKLGKREKGIANMKKILEINSENAHALNFLGYTYAEMEKNLKEAEAFIRKALKLRPNDGYIEDSLGWVLFKRGKLEKKDKLVEKAIERLKHASTLQPEEPIILEHLGDIYSYQKNQAEAVVYYKKAYALSSKKDKEMAKKIQDKLAALEKDKRQPSKQ